MIPGCMTVCELVYIIQQHLKRTSNPMTTEEALYCHHGDVPQTLKCGTSLSWLYENCRDSSDDGFLYITYSAENTLGGMCRAPTSSQQLA
mmetsp:Transcript_22195/g.40841  ORF Transcript_22195/g.40841 Transcript_22195/m.40841 type:complete len:90 (+) Transcript_22195:23-292(+)